MQLANSDDYLLNSSVPDWSLVDLLLSPQRKSVKAPIRNAATLVRYAEILRSSPSPNDVRLVFPGRNGEQDLELWTNKEILSDVSPYYATQLSSDVIEGAAVSSKRRKVERRKPEPEQKEFDDSDDERDDAIRHAKTGEAINVNEGHLYHQINITQNAYTTYAALLSWITTGHLTFTNSVFSLANPSLPACSPKSLYRLSHLLEIPELAKYSLDTIRAELTINNVASLLFSDLPVAYEEVREVGVGFAARNWKDVKGSEGMKVAQALAKSEMLAEWGPIAVELLMAVG